ncbi:hypothetical protein J23TS9_18290 [Paenibacillus sp. J23TS9]|uniref:hypothetical protein n=1 Tax=Paenibacillus sp. J23TS9 TaxID=2807193 RepID=UPI001B2BB9E1|nr:hypothetical protein [Paenibacillus sp. J23TS9]GIP26699.1 hypothetical protein J23TS9_18290 [Paenibacillus sp. J23TS9]
MNKRINTYAVVLLGIIVLSQYIAHDANAASSGVSPVTKSTTAAFMLDKLGSITLKSNVSVKLTDMDVFTQPGGNILTYTLIYSNGTSNRVDLIDYFTKITTTGGTVIQGKSVTIDAGKKMVPAKSSQTVTYYVHIGKAIKLNGVKVSIFGWDFNSANYQKRLGVFTTPGGYTSLVPQGQSQKIMMNNLPVTTKAESLQKIQMNGKVYMKIGVSLANLGTKVLINPDYKAYLKSSGGSVFELKLEDASSNYKVQPQEKKTIYYLAEVPSYMKTDNMTLQFAYEDPTLKMNLPVKSFKLPGLKAADSAVADYAVKKIFIANNAVETQLKSAAVYAENESAKWSLQFRIKNLGNKSVTLPAYELAIKAAEGFSIPVNSNGLANLTIKPLEEKIIDLSGVVPLKLNQSALQLLLTEPSIDGKVVFPTAYYKIPYSQESNNTLGIEYLIENNHGKFGVKLDSIQRLPWAEGDQITAKISIRNASLNTVQLPTLQALVKAGMNDLSGTVQIVTKNTLTSLAPSETTEMYVLARVPYSYSFSQLRIILQETSGDDVTKFLSMNTNAVNTMMNTVKAGGSYHINTNGQKAEVKERRSNAYSDNSSNLIYTELETISEEPRQSKQAQLVAYYKTPDNQFYEAKVSQSSNSTIPNGKNLVTVWSKIPQNVNTSDLVLYIGEGIAEDKSTESPGSMTGYINAVGLSLNPIAAKPSSNLKNVDLFPYNLSITKAEGTLAEGSDTINTVINYSLTKNNEYETGTYEHKLVLELTDSYGQSTEKTLTFGTDWTIGNNKSYSTALNSSLYKKLTGGSIRMNLYDEFQGRRILMGSQSYPIIYEKAPKEVNE